MNMHPGDRRSNEENEEADLAKKEETTPIGHSRSSEMTKTPIHVEAEVGFSVGLLLISRFRWVLFICAFGAVYAAAFWGFVGLISAAFIIGRGFHQKGGQIDCHNFPIPCGCSRQKGPPYPTLYSHEAKCPP